MISPAIHFPGNCTQAVNFYQKVFNATDKHIELYRDAPLNPGFHVSEDMKDLVMHAEMTICGTKVNFSDTQDNTIAGNMIVLNVFFESADEVCRAFAELKEGGNVIVELGSQFFSPMYGSIADRFGVRWQLIS